MYLLPCLIHLYLLFIHVCLLNLSVICNIERQYINLVTYLGVKSFKSYDQYGNLNF